MAQEQLDVIARRLEQQFPFDFSEIIFTVFPEKIVNSDTITMLEYLIKVKETCMQQA